MRDPFDRFLLIAAIVAVVLTALMLIASADCPPEGDTGDPALNTLKNRVTKPADVRSMTLADVLALKFQAPKADRARWAANQRDDAAKLEGTAVAITGYLVGAKQEGPEASNCHGDGRDLHVFLADSTDATKAHAMVVEITPHPHPVGWTLAAIRKLVRDGRQVRITGWLMYDQEHGPDVGRSRATLWEIHPVTGIELFEGQKWRPL